MRALLVIDMQNDFMPFGALPVAQGDAVVPFVNALMPRFELVVATQDWHPPDHGSFAVNHAARRPGDVIDLEGVEQVLWPAHCVQGTPGASFHSALEVARFDEVIRKGTDPAIDSYSGFFDNARRKATGLERFLRAHDADDIWVCGLATDYCVKYTVLDALSLGLRATLVADACRAVDLEPGDGERAIAQMAEAGADVVRSDTGV